ncbi:hypothetical protein MD484_g1354, partial [Candolleomyces efflorescens]
MTTLEDLLPEIWAQILDTACLDDGSTARSLSLVSRQIHYLSRSHLYYAIKVDSVPQLLKLDDQISKSIPDSMKGDGYFLKTRFLCIGSSKPLFNEAYPEETFVPEDDPDGTSYPGSSDDESDSDDSDDASDLGSSDDDSYNSEDNTSWISIDTLEPDHDADSGSDDDATGRFYGQEEDSEDEQDLQEELEAELADITNDPACKSLGRVKISSLSELLKHPNLSSLEGLIYRVYSAIRRLLDACAETLEIFSLYFLPWKLLSPELFIPPLPKLHRLSVYVPDGCEWAEHTGHPPTLFPSLKVFRMVNNWYHELEVAWWLDLLKSCSECSSGTLRIMTAKVVSRDPDWSSALKKWKGRIRYRFLTGSTMGCLHSPIYGLTVASEWWLDDMLGGDIVLTNIGNKYGHFIWTPWMD